MVCTLEPWQDLVFTDSTFGPDTACFQNNMSFQSTVIGCETWIITKDMAAKLSAFATSCCRIMLNIKCLHKVSNHRVYDLNGISQLSYCGMATFCAWRRMDQLTFYFVWAHPPPPFPPPLPTMGKDSQGDCISPFQPSPGMDQPNFFYDTVHTAQDQASWRRLSIDCSLVERRWWVILGFHGAFQR